MLSGFPHAGISAQRVSPRRQAPPLTTQSWFAFHTLRASCKASLKHGVPTRRSQWRQQAPQRARASCRSPKCEHVLLRQICTLSIWEGPQPRALCQRWPARIAAPMPKGSHSEFAQIKGAGICAQERMRLAYLCELLLSGFKVCRVVGLNFGVHLDLIRLGYRIFDLDRLELALRSRLDSFLRVTRTPRIRKPATCIYLRVITVPSDEQSLLQAGHARTPRAEWGAIGPQARRARPPGVGGERPQGRPRRPQGSQRLHEAGCLTTYEACFASVKSASFIGSVTMTSPLTWAE